jgi:hypothetical protein
MAENHKFHIDVVRKVVQKVVAGNKALSMQTMCCAAACTSQQSMSMHA